MRVFKGVSVLLVVLTTLFISVQTYAQSDTGSNAREFGLGQPASIQDLPPGLLRNRLESLPPQASSKALRWLQDFSFPAADVSSIAVDDDGGVFYINTQLPDAVNVDAADSAAPTTSEATPTGTLDDAFLLHSKPGSNNVLFVDFDGMTISGTAWNGTYSVLEALPYNLDTDGSTFSDTERTRIVDIWHRIAEDLAPFDIDVTTEEPTTFTPTTGTVLVTHSIDANNHAIYCTSCGGVAYVGVFGRYNYATYYSPALVFFDKLGSGYAPYVAEAGSHEFGHNLSLSHDGTTTGDAYYRGHGSGLVSWAPIMGVGYYNNVTEWSKGEYTNANNTQDDLNIIDGYLGYFSDDHGDTRTTASTLSVGLDGSVVSSNPELDPHNILADNKGIVGSSNDVDVFSFATGAGALSLTVNPAWDAFYRATSNRGANLDIDIELQDLSGTTVAAADPITDTNATINTTVTEGTYYLLVTGVGNTVSPYTDYASLGQYYINGTVPPAAPDNNAPTPDPMSWASVPAAISHTAISMIATTAVDDISAIEYNFLCTIGGTGCVNSGWQSGTGYTATGLASSSQYIFSVMARDQAGNETAASVTGSATTFEPPPPPVTPSGMSAAAVSETAIDLAWTDNANTETGYRVERSPGGAGSFSTIANLGSNANSYNDTGLDADTTYDYRVAAVNDYGDSAYATASGTTDAPPPYTNYSASTDTTVAGTVSGSVVDTRTDGGSSQSITERDSGGKPSKRHSYLEHRWNFNVSLGASVTVYANAWSGGSTEGDTFDFEYSLDNGSSFSPLFNVSSENTTNLQSAVIPGAPSGAIMIRVVDTDQTEGNREQNTVFVDHLYIQVGNPSNDPPIGDPSGMTANASSPSQIDLLWTDGVENEAGFTVESSLNGSTGWTTPVELPAGSTGYSDTGLAEDTLYFYRVRAFNANGYSAYTIANATTPVTPPPPPEPDITLTVTGVKVTGKYNALLSWTGSSSVDVYRNGSKINTVTGTSYDDNIRAKGGTTYTHQVCDTDTADCSAVITTTF